MRAVESAGRVVKWVRVGFGEIPSSHDSVVGPQPASECRQVHVGEASADHVGGQDGERVALLRGERVDQADVQRARETRVGKVGDVDLVVARRPRRGNATPGLPPSSTV